MVRGEPVSTFSGTQGFEEFSARVEPHSPGLADRIWYGAGSRRSTQWAAEQGLNLLTSNIIKPEPSDLETDGRWDFAAIQQSQRKVGLARSRRPGDQDCTALARNGAGVDGFGRNSRSWRWLRPGS